MSVKRVIKQIEKEKAAIAKHRDRLRALMDDLEGEVSSFDEGISNLEAAVEALSQYV